MLTGIKFIYFDIGYTLVNEDTVWQTRCREQALTIEARNLGLSAQDIYGEIIKASQQYLPQYRAVVTKYRFKEVAPYRSELETLYPQALDVLAQLSSTYKLGIIANQADGLDARLTSFGIRHYFTQVISSWDVGIQKPDPALFRLGIEKSGCAPDEILMVGDRLDNDIFPANILGMKTVWIKQGFGGMQRPLTPQHEPTQTIQSLTELLGIL